MHILVRYILYGAQGSLQMVFYKERNPTEINRLNGQN